jgi:hypothetical protein
VDRLTTIPLFGRGFSSQSALVTTQKLVNAYRSPGIDPDKSPLPIYGTPGLDLQFDLGAPVRGGIVIDDFIYVAVSNHFYGVNSAGTILISHSIAPGFSLPVYFAWNGTQLMFVDGMNGWIFTPSTAAFAQIVDVDFPQVSNGQSPTTCAWLGGYFFVSIGGSGKFQWSAVNDGTSWDPLDFATAETAPDNLIRIEADGGQLILFGERTTEFWALSGDANVMRRVGGSGIEWGGVASRTVAKFTTGLAFLAQNRLGEVQAGVLNGYQFQPFSQSDPDINHDINNRSRADLQAATAFSYFMNGHAFYQLNFPDKSYLYDALTDSWSQMSSSSTFGARHYADVRLALSQQPYVTDYRNGFIYLLDENTYTDNGDPIITELTTKHIWNSGNRLTVRELALEIEAGDGTQTGQGANPQIMGSWSNDGGQTWGNEIWNGAGQIGAYQQRAVWRNLGRARDFAVKFRISDPIKRVVIGATAAVQP